MKTTEHKFGERMVRESIRARLLGLLDESVPDQRARHHIEEAIVDLTHEIFEAGISLGEDQPVEEVLGLQAEAYLLGVDDEEAEQMRGDF